MRYAGPGSWKTSRRKNNRDRNRITDDQRIFSLPPPLTKLRRALPARRTVRERLNESVLIHLKDFLEKKRERSVFVDEK